jgi:hypothetical protein
MSLPGSGKGGGNGDSVLVTVMFIVTTLALLVGIFAVSWPLHQFYGKYLWNW